MKLKVVIVDLEIPRRAKKWGLRIGIPAAVLLGGGAVAYAAGLVTWSSGQTLQASDLNGNFTYVQGEITALQAEVHPASAFHAWATASPQFASGSVTTVVFDHVEFDLGSEYDSTTGVFTAKNAGYYLVQCQLIFYNGSSSAAYEIGLSIYDNTTEVAEMSWAVPEDDFPQPEITNLVHVAAGDTLTCAVAQYSGAAQAFFLGDPKRLTFSAARLY